MSCISLGRNSISRTDSSSALPRNYYAKRHCLNWARHGLDNASSRFAKQGHLGISPAPVQVASPTFWYVLTPIVATSLRPYLPMQDWKTECEFIRQPKQTTSQTGRGTMHPLSDCRARRGPSAQNRALPFGSRKAGPQVRAWLEPSCSFSVS